jgi:hypothetical protein
MLGPGALEPGVLDAPGALEPAIEEDALGLVLLPLTDALRSTLVSLNVALAPVPLRSTQPVTVTGVVDVARLDGAGVCDDWPCCSANVQTAKPATRPRTEMTCCFIMT